MKKIFCLLLILVMSFSLASCGGEQTVTVKNDKGENVEVVLKKSTEDEVIKNAMLYASQADYEEVDGLKLSLNGEGEFVLNNEENLKASLNASLGLDNTNTALYGELNGSASGKLKETNDAGLEELVSHSSSASAHVAFSMAKDNPDLWVYLGANTTLDGKEVTNEKVKISLVQLALILGNLIPNIPGLNPSASIVKRAMPKLPGMPDFKLPTEEDILNILTELKKAMPNSNLEITHVSGKSFTITYNLSMKDALKKIDEINETTLSSELKEDFKVSFNASFEIETGRLANINLEANNAFFIKLMDEDNEITADTKANLKLSLEASYGSEKIKVLTKEEKEQYIDLLA